MGKLLFQDPVDFFVEVSVCSLNTFLSLDPFEVVASPENQTKIERALQLTHHSKFVLFPEYTYSDNWRHIFQNHSDQSNSIIIAGTGLEEIENNFYAYAPIFFPNGEMQKVYKTHVTIAERMYSRGRIINYPGPVQRHFRLFLGEGENEIVFSVFVCYDFIRECDKQTDRSDIIFVPQYEESPDMFIYEGDKCAKGERNFVLGANNADNSLRSYGFSSLNSSVINTLHRMNLRLASYKKESGRFLPYHHTIFYDTEGERVLKFALNLGRPYSLPYTYSMRQDPQPVIIPISNNTF